MCQSWEGPLFSFSMFVWPYVYNVLTPSIDMYGWRPSQLWHRWIDGESGRPMSLGDMMSWGLCGVCPCPTPIWKFSPPPNEMSLLVSSLDNILHLHPTPIRDNLVVSFETCLHPQTRQSRLSHLNQWCSNVTLGGSTATSWEARAAKVHSTPHTMPHPYISIEGVRTLGAVHILRYTILASFWPIPY